MSYSTQQEKKYCSIAGCLKTASTSILGLAILVNTTYAEKVSDDAQNPWVKKPPHGLIAEATQPSSTSGAKVDPLPQSQNLVTLAVENKNAKPLKLKLRFKDFNRRSQTRNLGVLEPGETKEFDLENIASDHSTYTIYGTLGILRSSSYRRLQYTAHYTKIVFKRNCIGTTACLDHF